MIAPIPANENERLNALRRYSVLDSPPEEAFDRVTRLVARLLGVPIATVTLIDETRQWFKSAHGLNVRATPREVSFCAHAILYDSVTVVSDATRDSRFADNPLVIDEPRIRFYAGIPLQSSDGYNLGTLCAIDRVPRELSAEQEQILRDLAAIVTDELELRRAVRERNQQAVAINNLTSGVLVTDPMQSDNPIVFCNPGFSAMTGYDFPDIVGRNCRFLQGGGTDRDAIAEIRAAIAERRPIQRTLLNYRKDGTPFWNELTISPVFADNGELINFIGLQTDVTERKKLEKLRDDLTHMIVHDLRSPLTVVIGYLDLLRRASKDKLSPQQIQYIAAAEEGAQRLNDLITSVLDISRLEAGAMPLNQQVNDLAQIVRETAELFSAGGAGKKSISVNLPHGEILAVCDADLVRRVLENLLNNALKFTPAGAQVAVTLSSGGQDASVSVVDRGPGIPAELQDRIFEKFGQVEGSPGRHSTGLGLAFCKLAIQAQGGAIGVKSEPGYGSNFYFTLPRAETGTIE